MLQGVGHLIGRVEVTLSAKQLVGRVEYEQNSSHVAKEEELTGSGSQKEVILGGPASDPMQKLETVLQRGEYSAPAMFQICCVVLREEVDPKKKHSLARVWTRLVHAVPQDWLSSSARRNLLSLWGSLLSNPNSPILSFSLLVVFVRKEDLLRACSASPSLRLVCKSPLSACLLFGDSSHFQLSSFETDILRVLYSNWLLPFLPLCGSHPHRVLKEKIAQHFLPVLQQHFKTLQHAFSAQGKRNLRKGIKTKSSGGGFSQAARMAHGGGSAGSGDGEEDQYAFDPDAIPVDLVQDILDLPAEHFELQLTGFVDGVITKGRSWLREDKVEIVVGEELAQMAGGGEKNHPKEAKRPSSVRDECKEKLLKLGSLFQGMKTILFFCSSDGGDSGVVGGGGVPVVKSSTIRGKYVEKKMLDAYLTLTFGENEKAKSSKLRRVVEQFCPATFNGKRLRGVFLSGPPGTGKSHVPMTLAESLGLYLTHDKNQRAISRFMSKYFGETQKKIEKEFNLPQMRPWLLHMMFLDEAEIGLRERGSGDSEASVDFTNSFLPFLENKKSDEPNANLLLFAATNFKEKVDQAVIRSGRFDTHIYFGCQTAEERQVFLENVVETMFPTSSSNKEKQDSRSGGELLAKAVSRSFEFWEMGRIDTVNFSYADLEKMMVMFRNLSEERVAVMKQGGKNGVMREMRELLDYFLECTDSQSMTFNKMRAMHRRRMLASGRDEHMKLLWKQTEYHRSFVDEYVTLRMGHSLESRVFVVDVTRRRMLMEYSRAMMRMMMSRNPGSLRGGEYMAFGMTAEEEKALATVSSEDVVQVLLEPMMDMEGFDRVVVLKNESFQNVEKEVKLRLQQIRQEAMHYNRTLVCIDVGDLVGWNYGQSQMVIAKEERLERDKIETQRKNESNSAENIQSLQNSQSKSQGAKNTNAVIKGTGKDVENQTKNETETANQSGTREEEKSGQNRDNMVYHNKPDDNRDRTTTIDGTKVKTNTKEDFTKTSNGSSTTVTDRTSNQNKKEDENWVETKNDSNQNDQRMDKIMQETLTSNERSASLKVSQDQSRRDVMALVRANVFHEILCFLSENSFVGQSNTGVSVEDLEKKMHVALVCKDVRLVELMKTQLGWEGVCVQMIGDKCYSETKTMAEEEEKARAEMMPFVRQQELESNSSRIGGDHCLWMCEDMNKDMFQILGVRKSGEKKRKVRVDFVNGKSSSAETIFGQVERLLLDPEVSGNVESLILTNVVIPENDDKKGRGEKLVELLSETMIARVHVGVVIEMKKKNALVPIPDPKMKTGGELAGDEVSYFKEVPDFAGKLIAVSKASCGRVSVGIGFKQAQEVANPQTGNHPQTGNPPNGNKAPEGTGGEQRVGAVERRTVVACCVEKKDGEEEKVVYLEKEPAKSLRAIGSFQATPQQLLMIEKIGGLCRGYRVKTKSSRGSSSGGGKERVLVLCLEYDSGRRYLKWVDERSPGGYSAPNVVQVVFVKRRVVGVTDEVDVMRIVDDGDEEQSFEVLVKNDSQRGNELVVGKRIAVE